MLHNRCVSRGGAERQIFSLSRELRRLGYQVEVAVIQYDKAACFPELVDATKITSLSKFLGHDIFKAIPVVQALELALRLPEGYDLLHAHNFPSAIAALLATRLRSSYADTPYIWQCNEPPRILHDQWEIDRFIRQPETPTGTGRAAALLGIKTMHMTSKQIDKIAARNAAAVTAVSSFVADQIERIYKLRARVVNPGIDLETFNPHVKGERIRSKYGIHDSPLLLTVSRLWPAKNLETALRSFRIVADNFEDAHYIIVGDGPSRPNLQDLVNRLRLTGRVRFVYDAEVEVLAEYYAACDIFVFPALSEPWGLSLLEAMATGKPIVAADDGGPAEIVDHKVDGLLVKPADSNSYAEAIIQLLKDRSTMECIGERAAAKAKNYSWERMASAYSQIYDSLL
jgi:glycosyltransferase involved in cell wall biosynthesis